MIWRRAPTATNTTDTRPPMRSAVAQPQVLCSSSSFADPGRLLVMAGSMLALSGLPSVAGAQAEPPAAATPSTPAAASPSTPATERAFFISLSPASCELQEAGRLATPAEPDESKLRQVGELTETETAVYRCAVTLPPPSLPAAPYACRLTGFEHQTLYFFKGDVRNLRRGCDVRRLRDGSLYFGATGIAADLCAFSCSGP